jgi:anthranilate phosphoribosyltransferase
MLTEPLAQVLGQLGGRAAFVVHGHDGLDELTTGGPTRMSYLREGEVTTFELDAQRFGLRPATRDDLRGGEPADNARMLRAVLDGEDSGPRRDVVLLNAAAALALADDDAPNDPVAAVAAALAQAAAALDSGAALNRLNALAALSQSLTA